MSIRTCLTVFENHQKYRIWIFQFRHFPSIFVQLKVTCLLTLFDYFRFSKTRRNGLFLEFFMNFCPLKCRIWIFLFRHFPLIFVLLKLTCLATLFDHKLQVFKSYKNWPFLAFIIYKHLFTQWLVMLNETFSVIFKHCVPEGWSAL